MELKHTLLCGNSASNLLFYGSALLLRMLTFCNSPTCAVGHCCVLLSNLDCCRLLLQLDRIGELLAQDKLLEILNGCLSNVLQRLRSEESGVRRDDDVGEGAQSGEAAIPGSHA